MVKRGFFVVLAALLYPGVAFCDQDQNISKSVSFRSPGTLSFHFPLGSTSSMSIGAQASLSETKTSTGTFDSDAYALALGFRKYFRIETLSTFADMDLASVFIHNSNEEQYSMRLFYGVMYDLSPKISVEGRAGISLRYQDDLGGTLNSINFPATSVGIVYRF